MYKKTTKELVNRICEMLNEHGFVDTYVHGEKAPYTPKYGFGAGLMYVPTENLEKIIDCEVKDWSEFIKVYNTWGRAGLLRFKPYSDHSKDNPSLVIRHNRYLHMFRGYRFQASYTVQGEGAASSGSYRTDFLMYRVFPCLTSYILWWAAYIDVGFQFNNFMKAFENDRQILEDFLHESMAFWRHETQYHWSDVEDCIKVDKTPIDVNARKMYQLTDDGVSVAAYLAIGKETVQVQTVEKTLTFTFPNLSEGLPVSYSEDEEYMEEMVERLEDNHYREMIAVMLLKLAGIHISFINWYPLSHNVDLMRMRPINASGIINVKSLDNIYKAEPDEL